jgi:hypothetical protein
VQLEIDGEPAVNNPTAGVVHDHFCHGSGKPIC